MTERTGKHDSIVLMQKDHVMFINRIRANHYNLNDSLARKGYIDSARCNCGNEKESIEHVLCNIYDKEKFKMDYEKR